MVGGRRYVEAKTMNLKRANRNVEKDNAGVPPSVLKRRHADVDDDKQHVMKKCMAYKVP